MSEVSKLSEKLEKRFDKIDAKLVNHDESFERFFKYMEKRFNEMDRRFDKAAADRADIRGAVPDYADSSGRPHERSY